MTDPGAEMKARALRATESFDNHDPVLRNQFAEFAAAFAAKEVARATEETSTRLKQVEEFLLGRDQRESPAESLAALLARAVEEERMANCKAICNRCEDASLAYPAKLIDGRWTHAYTASTVTAPCLAHPIHERSQVKGEGL